MRKTIKLFINNQEVDYSETLNLPMTYTVEDFNKPTIVKNSFSKTITIPGTKKNNKIFGEIYKLDRFLASHPTSTSGVKFDPSKRVDFKIFENATLIESGYMQLNRINIVKQIISYDITLYGGLGDFFYNLMYDENGEKRSLSSLQFFVEDYEGNVLNKDEEMNFQINKDFVKRCFDSPLMENNTLTGFLTFIPSYNGLYEDFDNEAVLINANNSTLFNDTYIEEGGKSYETYNGYALAELNKSYTEWEMRDLRSYMQRPALRLKQLIKTICNPVNNGGYEVELDKSFFNESNAYWDKAFVALPLLNTIVESDEETYNSYLGTDSSIAYKLLTSSGSTNFSLPLAVTSTSEVPVSDNLIDIRSLGDGFKKLDFSITYSLKFDREYNYDAPNIERYFIGFWDMEGNFKQTPRKAYIDVWITITDQNDKILWTSTVNRHTSINNDFKEVLATGNNSYGYFQKFEDGNFYWVESNTMNNGFIIDCENINVSTDYIKIKVNTNYGNCPQYDNMIVVGEKVTDRVWNYKYQSRGSLTYLSTVSSIDFTKLGNITTNTQITKDQILKGQYTPADYLLGYAKMFGLYFIKDISNKKITIMNRNKFFTGTVKNWSSRIDYSKDFKIEPLVFSSKFYRMNLETPDTYYSKKYENEYKLSYGQQRIHTNTNFNNETTDLFDNNVYENVVSVRDYSPYFRTYKNEEGKVVPSWIADGCDYKLFNFTGDVINNDYTIEYVGNQWVDLAKTVDWNINSGYDLFPKICCYESDKDAKNLSDINNSIVIYNGNINLTNVKGEAVSYWISDDVTEMYTLNDEPCYLYTDGPYSSLGDVIAIETTSLPQYTRMELTGNFVSASLDFGLPREVYIPEINYTEDKTLYAQYWKQFLGDQFNINTKKVTAFVRLDNLNNVNSQLLRDFYWFDNNIWMLNKIDSYNLNSDDTVKCEFIKINDVTNYTQGQFTVDRSLSITPPEAQLPYTAGTYTFRVTCTNPWSILSYNDTKITSISTTSGEPGSTDVTITYTENTSNAPEYFYVSIVIEGTVDSKSIDFVQAYNAETSITVSGIITNINNGEPVSDARILTYDKETGGNYVNVTYSNSEGYYAITANKNELYYVEVQYDLELGDDTVYKLLQPASSTDVTLNIGVDIPVQEEGDASGTYYFTLIGPNSSTNNEHLLTNGYVETDTNPSSYLHNVMYCNEGLVENLVGDGLTVNDVDTFSPTVVPVGGLVYWYWYDNEGGTGWHLINTISVENLNGGSRTFEQNI